MYSVTIHSVSNLELKVGRGPDPTLLSIVISQYLTMMIQQVMIPFASALYFVKQDKEHTLMWRCGNSPIILELWSRFQVIVYISVDKIPCYPYKRCLERHKKLY